MPDPRQMSGQVLPAPRSADGQRDRSRHSSDDGERITGITVELHGAGDVRRAVTAAQGRAQFDGLPVGARVHVVAVVDGERLESIEFPVPASGGARTLLAAGVGVARPAERPQVEPPSSSPASATGAGDRRRRLGAGCGHPLRDRVPGRPADGVLSARGREPIVVASDAGNAAGDRSTAGLVGSRADAGRVVEGHHRRLASLDCWPVPPGVTQVPVAFRIESWPADWTLTQRFPVALENVAVAAQKLSGMTLESPQATTVRETSFQGSPYLVATGSGLAAGTPLTITLRGLPHRSVDALYLGAGDCRRTHRVGPVGGKLHYGRRRPPDVGSSRRAGCVGCRHWSRSTAAPSRCGRTGTATWTSAPCFFASSSAIYRELDAMGDLPGGDQGLAA